MRPWQFGKPKTPGFGLRADFYLSVLASKAVLPAPRDVLNPKGDGGAVPGFIAPMVEGKDPELLSKPLQRGAYVVSTLDRKTVVQALVVSKEEAFFDPEPIVGSALAAELSAEALARIRGTWHLVQLRAVTHDPMVYSSLDFLLLTAVRIADLAEGVVADPIAQRYLLPGDVFSDPRANPQVDAREHVSVQHASGSVFTLGMRKFDLAELELADVPAELGPVAANLLISICQRTLQGSLAGSGDRVGPKGFAFELREGGFDRGRWEGVKVLELLPPTGVTVEAALLAWQGRP